jgi:hypothetical protein
MAGVSLRDDQLEAVSKMKNGCVLCGDTGSGKSRTSLAYYYSLCGGQLGTKNYVKMTSPIDLYIITTAANRDKFEWDDELIPFMLNRKPELMPYDIKVVVDSWNNVSKYRKVRDSFFIFDEQRVVGRGKQSPKNWVNSFLDITKHNKWVLLSATPGDKWVDYIPLFIANGFYKNRTEFNRRHVIYAPYSNFPQILGYVDEGHLIRLRRSILVPMDSYTHPAEKHHNDVLVRYNVAKYKDIARNHWNPWKNEPIETAAEYCQALRRVVNEDESRQSAILELLEDHPRAIIFYNYNYELDILRAICGASEGLEVGEWNGQKHDILPSGDRWAYLVQYTAGAEGWNCITTDTVIFYSQNYSYKVMKQAEGRIDRSNTPYRDLYYYHLKSQSGIDLAISAALRNKKKFNERDYAGGLK